MPITTIDKFKQPNGQTFYILESQDVEHVYVDENGTEQLTSVKDRLESLNEEIKNGVTIESLDERYYQKTEIDETLTGYATSDHDHIEYADAEHNHDDVYYTQDEIDSMVFITVEDIDLICGTTIEENQILTLAEGVSF